MPGIGEEEISLSAISEWSVAHLLERCSTRPPDEEAWQEFVRRYHATIRTNVIKTFHRKAKEESDRKPQFPEDMVEDLIQAVYTRLVEDRNRALDRFEGEHDNSIYQYLAMISINVVRDCFREIRAQKRPKISISLDELLETRGDPAVVDVAHEPRIGEDEIEVSLRKAVKGKNQDRDLMIFKLYYYEGLTHNEITELMNLDISAVSVGSILNRIVKKLRRLLLKGGTRR